jgi:hypothetical protein
VIEADQVAAAVRALMAERSEWTGTASQLLPALVGVVDERVAKSKSWPDDPRVLSGRLRRVAAFLRKAGVEISFTKEGRARRRVVRITSSASSAPENAGSPSSASSASSASISKPNPGNEFGAADLRTVGNAADDDGATTVLTVRANPLKLNDVTVADDADTNLRAQSEPGKPAWRMRL